MPDITQITQLGIGGLAVFFFYRLLSNHLAHLTRAVNKNTEVLGILTEIINEIKQILIKRR